MWKALNNCTIFVLSQQIMNDMSIWWHPTANIEDPLHPEYSEDRFRVTDLQLFDKVQAHGVSTTSRDYVTPL